MRVSKRYLICALATALALCFPALAESAQDDPVAVRVGKFSYPLSLVESSLSSAMDVASLLSGEEATDEDRQAGVEAAIQKFVNLGIVESKLSEKGKNDFTDAEIELMKSAAQSKYEELWQMLYQRTQQSGETVSDEDITGWLDGQGYTVEAIYDEYVVAERNRRAIELFCPDVKLTRAQVDAYYEEQFVGPDRERYQGDVARFEEEVVSANNEAFYIPEGYRYMRQITLDYPEAAIAATKAQESRMTNAMNAVASAFQELASAATTAESWDELADLRARYDKANEAAIACREEYTARLKEASEPLLRDTFAEIRTRYAAGIDFKSLIEAYSTDKTDRNLSRDGYLFHPDSTTWPDAFKAAAMKLEKPGEISDPVYSETGIHILYYAGEAPAGDHVLTEEEREQLNASALQYFQNARLAELCAEWKDDYDIETHPELLEY